MGHRTRGRLVVAVLVCALTACSSRATADRICNATGSFSAVGVSVPPGWTLNTFCVGVRCDEHPPIRSDELPVSDRVASYHYRIVAHSAHDTLFRYSGTIATHYTWVNGKDCPPRSANAGIVVDRHGRLSIAAPGSH